MTEATNGQTVPGTTYVAHLWDFPNLTLAIFGMQVSAPDGYARYEAANIPAQMEESLGQEPGLLGMRYFQEGTGGLMLQYWRSHEDLANFSKRMPHMAWWKWLIDNEGQGFSFYHEIYTCKTAEAIFETGTTPVGPGTFCELSPTELGGGRSVERQRLFEEAAAKQ